jgi:hypothetical protein
MDTEAANRVTVDRDVPYRETPDGTLHLDAYRPDDASGGGDASDPDAESPPPSSTSTAAAGARAERANSLARRLTSRTRDSSAST